MSKQYKCRAYLFCMYELLELSTTQIAKECEVVQSTIWCWLKKFNIKRRTISESKKGEKHPMYGKKGENNPLYGRTGEKHPMYGKHRNDATKKKISESNKKIHHKKKSSIAYKRFKQKKKEILKKIKENEKR